MSEVKGSTVHLKVCLLPCAVDSTGTLSLSSASGLAAGHARTAAEDRHPVGEEDRHPADEEQAAGRAAAAEAAWSTCLGLVECNDSDRSGGPEPTTSAGSRHWRRNGCTYGVLWWGGIAVGRRVTVPLMRRILSLGTWIVGHWGMGSRGYFAPYLLTPRRALTGGS